jgi:uncharacterized membrane protein
MSGIVQVPSQGYPWNGSREHDINYMPWTFSTFFYILAIIFLVLAVIYAIYHFVRCKDDKKRDRQGSNIPTWLLLGAIALGVLAIIQQGYEKGHAIDIVTRGLKKSY